jgi:hypothetical protein
MGPLEWKRRFQCGQFPTEREWPAPASEWSVSSWRQTETVTLAGRSARRTVEGPSRSRPGRRRGVAVEWPIVYVPSGWTTLARQCAGHAPTIGQIRPVSRGIPHPTHFLLSQTGSWAHPGEQGRSSPGTPPDRHTCAGWEVPWERRGCPLHGENRRTRTHWP